jgi:hypothetical protein
MIEKQLTENIFKLLLTSEVSYYEDDLTAKSAVQQAEAMIKFYDVLQPVLNEEEMRHIERLRKCLPNHR